MKVKGIIFDLDGTLVDTIDDIGDSTNILLNKYGFDSYTRENFIEWIGNGAVRFVQNAVGEKVSREQLNAYVMEFKEIYEENLHKRSRLYEGVTGMLNELEYQGVKLSILSNKPHHLTKKVVDYYLSAWPFDPVFGQREEVARKPDPAAAFEIAGMMKLKPQNILFVGDSRGDLETAKAAGMIPMGVTWGYGQLVAEHRNEQVKIVEHPQELLDYIGTKR
jgi:phosphoglycolate phosphatase